jgi:hypothetical protein
MPTYLNINQPPQNRMFANSYPQNTIPCLQIYNHVQECPVCAAAYSTSKMNTTSADEKKLTDKFPVFFNEIYISPSIIVLIIVFIIMSLVIWFRK